jgi:RNA polymerase sigma-70 factor, ECF subfamily
MAMSDAILMDAQAPARSLDAEGRLRAMVDQHFDFIWRSLRALGVPSWSVDDAAQHVFWVASQKLDAIEQGRERAFLFGTAMGVAANARRSSTRSREVPYEAAIAARADDAPNALELLERKQERELLDRALESMPDDLRAVFVLFVLEGATTPEISELLGLAPGTVASRLRRAREAFHKIAKRLQAGAGGGLP